MWFVSPVSADDPVHDLHKERGCSVVIKVPGGHGGEVIPVPIPNTEVKLSYADDTAFAGK